MISLCFQPCVRAPPGTGRSAARQPGGSQGREARRADSAPGAGQAGRAARSGSGEGQRPQRPSRRCPHRAAAETAGTGPREEPQPERQAEAAGRGRGHGAATRSPGSSCGRRGARGARRSGPAAQGALTPPPRRSSTASCRGCAGGSAAETRPWWGGGPGPPGGGPSGPAPTCPAPAAPGARPGMGADACTGSRPHLPVLVRLATCWPSRLGGVAPGGRSHEESREMHQVQDAGETSGSCPLGSSPCRGVDGFKQTDKVMTDCARPCEKCTRVMREIVHEIHSDTQLDTQGP